MSALDQILQELAKNVPAPVVAPNAIPAPTPEEPHDQLPRLQPSETTSGVSTQTEQTNAEPGAKKETYRPYFNAEAFPPSYTLAQETPAHRYVCTLFAQGKTRNEVAQETGFSPVTVAYIRKQSWAMELIAELQQAAGKEAVVQELKGAALDAARTLIAIAKPAANAKDSDRIKAAQLILDRMYPVPSFHVHGKVDPDEMTDAELVQLVGRGETVSNA